MGTGFGNKEFVGNFSHSTFSRDVGVEAKVLVVEKLDVKKKMKK